MNLSNMQCIEAKGRMLSICDASTSGRNSAYERCACGEDNRVDTIDVLALIMHALHR
jgi:hypothetical protein